MMPRPMTRIPGGRADRGVAELERMYALEKPVPLHPDRVETALLALVTCLAIMGFTAMCILEVSR